MRIFLLLFLLTFTFSCATRNIKYDRNKILKKYSADYKTFVDNQNMNLENVYLDKDNIENIRIDKKAKELKITQFKRTELFKLNNLNLDSLSSDRRGWNKNEIGLIIIDGVPLTKEIQSKTLIDWNSVKNFRILRGEDLKKKGTTIFRTDRDYLIITTK